MSNPIIELQNRLRTNSNNNPFQNNPQAQQVRQLLRQIKMANNPSQALNQMLMNNPQLSSVLQLVKSNGGNPQTAFLNYARQLGVDPQEVLNFLNS